jgi:hypothetical protein
MVMGQNDVQKTVRTYQIRNLWLLKTGHPGACIEKKSLASGKDKNAHRMPAKRREKTINS